MPFLYSLVILLVAAVLAVPLAKRLGFGSVLGYLGAGLLIGPAGLALVSDVEAIASVSELGVVMLLFLIGLELRPARLWTMRRSVLGLGAAQVVLTAAALFGAGVLAGFAWHVALVAGFALSLSSTAIVLPMLAERNLLSSHAGRDSFAVLLFQDIAVIPAVALLPLLAGGSMGSAQNTLLAVAQAALALGLVFVGGRFLVRPIFRLVDSAKTPEIFTASALLVVMGTAVLVSAAGLSMSLGAFIAGMLLSDSDYRHEIRADIQPFEGLLLGVFFISVGMSANLGLLATSPGQVLGLVLCLLLIKGIVAFALAKLSGQSAHDATRFAFALSQGGEFGFVLLAAAAAGGIVAVAQSEFVTLAISMSMIASVLLFWLEERWIAPFLQPAQTRPYDAITAHTDILICGFGRVGQIVGRLLRMRGIAFTALDKNAEQIELVRRFGAQAYYGDAARLDLLREAGAAEAKILVIALDDVADSLMVADHAKRHFPNVAVLARARNRRHAHLLMDRGVTNIVRETLHSSLHLSTRVMAELGIAAEDAQRTVALFQGRDEKLLVDSHGFYGDEKQMIQTTKQVTEELQGLLEADRVSSQH